MTHLTTQEIESLKERLSTELALVEKELKEVGRKNPSNPKDWEPTEGETDMDAADELEVASGITQYEEHSAILKELEIRYNEILKALEKIKAGTYGVCEISGKPIEKDRLNANPAALTCKEHMNAHRA